MKSNDLAEKDTLLGYCSHFCTRGLDALRDQKISVEHADGDHCVCPVCCQLQSPARLRRPAVLRPRHVLRHGGLYSCRLTDPYPRSLHMERRPAGARDDNSRRFYYRRVSAPAQGGLFRTADPCL